MGFVTLREGSLCTYSDFLNFILFSVDNTNAMASYHTSFFFFFLVSPREVCGTQYLPLLNAPLGVHGSFRVNLFPGFPGALQAVMNSISTSRGTLTCSHVVIGSERE